MTTSLVEIMRPRAQAVAQGISEGLWRWGSSGYFGGLWRGYNASEQLVGSLIADDAVMYHRPGNEKAKIWFTRIKPIGIANVDFGDDRIVEDNVLEKEHDHFKVPKSVVVTETIEHKFTKVTTRENAFKQGLELAFKESLRFGGEKSKLGGGLEFQQTLTASFEEKYGTGETQEDTARRTVSVAGPKDIRYTAIRRTTKKEQPVSVNADLDCQVNIDDETQISTRGQTIWELLGGKQPPTTNRVHIIWDSVLDLISVFKGEAPISLPLSPQFTGNPLNAGVLEAVVRKPEHANWINRFSEVQSLDIDIEDEAELGDPDLIPLQPNVASGGTN